ncbi:MAG: hypothetical protein METHP_00500 [Methanoregula sp. SKADARSKE-2]|nr:MAG: hypothetical protein METHP_00500 [Methanoregula sp. SKADARSKE-2]
MSLSRIPDLPELLDRYMESSGRSKQWITVKDIRTRFQLAESNGPAISGFLSKIHHGSFFSCRYKVARIEKFRDTAPPHRLIRKYFVEERPARKKHRAAGVEESFR